TRIVIRLVAGPWGSAGTQKNVPVLGLIEAPTGAPGSRLKLNCCPPFGSVALAVKASRVPSVTDLLPIGASTGGRFDSSTTILIVSKSPREGVPLSVTR